MSNGVAIFDIDDQNVMWLSNYYERGLVRVVLQKILILIRSHLFIFAFVSITLGGGS